MCIMLHLENIASRLGWILNCKFRPLNSQSLAVQSQCQIDKLCCLRLVGIHSSAVNHRMADTMASTRALFSMTIFQTGIVWLCPTTAQHM